MTPQTPLEEREALVARFVGDCGEQNDDLTLGVLISALSDPMWQIRYVANGELRRMTGHDEPGFHYRAAQNEDGIRAWKEWLHDHRRDWRDQHGMVFGIGAFMCSSKSSCDDTRGCVLTTLFDDFPAVKAGLKQGDLIDAVDGDPVAGKRCGDVTNYEILGNSDAAVVLGVRHSDGSHVDVKIARQALVWPVGTAAFAPHGKQPMSPVGSSHTFTRTPLRQLFDSADFVADVFPKKLEQGNGDVGNASLFASRIFKGDQHQRTIDYSWDTFWAPRPFMLGQSYFALLRHGEAVTEDEAFLNEESISVDPVKGVTDHCRPMTGTDTVSCRVFKVYGRGQQGVLFDSSMVHHLTMHVPEVVPRVTGMIEVVFVEDVEHAFCEWGGTCVNGSPR
jgi:hypothetical protein